jgi:hypothetical protein
MRLSLKGMLDLFNKKFPKINNFHLLKSLTYFEDADEDANPKVFTKITWAQVKKQIEKEVHELL